MKDEIRDREDKNRRERYNTNQILVEANRRKIEELAKKHGGNFYRARDVLKKRICRKIHETITLAREIEFYESLNEDGTHHPVCGYEPAIYDAIKYLLRASGLFKLAAGVDDSF